MKKLREKQPPPYLDGRVAGKSILSRRSMRAPAGRFVQFLLCLVAMMSLSVERASAYDSWQDSWISQWYDAANATIVLDIRVYQSWGGAGDGHCGFLAESGWLKVKVAGYSIKIQGPSGTWNKKSDLEKYVTDDKGEKLNSEVSVEWLGDRVVTDNGKSAYFLKITVPLTQDRLNSDQLVEYEGTWWRRYDLAADESVDFDEKVDTRFGCTPTIISEAHYDVRNHEPGYVIVWKKDGKATKNSIDGKGYFKLCYSNGDPVANMPTIDAGIHDKGEFFIPAKNLNLDNPSEYKIIQRYEPSYNKKVVYETSSAVKTRLSYPQVKEIEANYNTLTRKVKVD